MATTLKVRSSSLAIDWLRGLVVAMLILGICFRFIAIDRKIYWHDEVYTSMRAAGYTRAEIDSEIFQNRMIPAPELQKFQQIKPNSTIRDTVRSLVLEDPQHPPLYFVMARFWMQLFGGSILASRLLPVLLSLIGLPLMYGLAMELFASRFIALLATAFLSLSPFDILFAQTARQYSLLTVTIIGSSWILLRAMRQPSWKAWIGYGLIVAAGLYTHPFFGLTLIAHGVYVGSITYQANRQTNREANRQASLSEKPVGMFKSGWSWLRDRRIPQFMLAVLMSLVLYSPWIWVLLHQYQRVNATTDWTRFSMGIFYLAKLWILSFTALFIDLDFGFTNPVTFLLRLPFVALILLALWRLYRHAAIRTWLFVLTSVLVPFLILVLPDLILGGKRSAVSRYLVSCFPGVQLAVASLFAAKVFTARSALSKSGKSLSKSLSKSLWQPLLVITFVASIISCGVSAASTSWWSKDLSYFNDEVIRLVNAEAETTSPVLLSHMGVDYTNMGDLVSMSYGLKDNVRLYLLSSTPDFAPLMNEPNILVFRAAKSLEDIILQQGWRLIPVSERGRLWRMQR